MVFVVVIVVAWAVILGPNLMRRRSRVGGINSISHFHRQLRILEHSAPPPIVSPAFRLRSVDGAGVPEPSDRSSGVVTPKLTVVGADQLPKPALAFLGQPAEETTEDAAVPLRPDGRVAGSPDSPSLPRPVDPQVRQLTLRRRRDALGALAAVFVVTLLIGYIPGASAAWVLTAVAGVSLGAYVALLVRLRRLADERERKLHYLHPGVSGVTDPSDPGHAGALGGRPVRVSGRYAHPSSQAVAR